MLFKGIVLILNNLINWHLVGLYRANTITIKKSNYEDRSNWRLRPHWNKSS